MARPKAYLSWSSGKDSAYALVETLRKGDFEVVGLITTVTAEYGRVSMHGVRESILDRQIAELRLPCRKVSIPKVCANEIYERQMAEVLQSVKDEGVAHVIFGDLFLEDIRSYRETHLKALDMTGVFPLWGRDTRALAGEMIASGLAPYLTCVDSRKLDASFAGRRFDEALLAELPEGIDPCGENGEFHTCVTAGPMFQNAIEVQVGDVVDREGFVFADLLAPEGEG